MIRIITEHNILKGFLVFAIADISLKTLVPKNLKQNLKWQFLYFKPILYAILVTIATGKSKIYARILYLGYSSNKQIR